MYPAKRLKLYVSILSTISFGVLFTSMGKSYRNDEYIMHRVEITTSCLLKFNKIFEKRFLSTFT